MSRWHTCIPVGCGGCLDDANALRAERDALAAKVKELDRVLHEAGADSAAALHEQCLNWAERAERAEAALAAEREAHAATKARYDAAMRASDKFSADADRWQARERGLRAALVELVQYERKRHPPKMGGDELPPSLRKLVEAADAALAAPAGEAKPRCHICKVPFECENDCPNKRSGR